MFQQKEKNTLNQADLDRVSAIRKRLHTLTEWTHDAIKNTIVLLAKTEEIKLSKIAQPLRVILCGSNVAPGIFDIMVVLGRDETLGRLEDVLKQKKPTCDRID